MTLTQHVTLTGAASVILLPFVTPLDVLVFAVGGILIDVDHYLLYIQRRRRFDVPGMFRYYDELQPIQNNIPYMGLCLFHTIDFFVLVAALAYFHQIFLPLLAGFLFHFFIDLYDLFRKDIFFIRPFFLVEHAIRRRSPGYPWY